MPDAPWIWVECWETSPVHPSMTLSFNSLSQRLSYSLHSIIYSGGNHFTNRFRDRLGGWWNHDGQIVSGVPQPDNV